MRLLEQKKEQKGQRENRLRFGAAAALFAAAAALFFLTAFVPALYTGFFYWSKNVCSILSVFTGFLPFSVAEAGLCGVAVWLIFGIRRLLRARKKGEKGAGAAAASRLLLGAGILFFLFVLLFGAGYRGQPLGERLELPIRARPVAELASVTKELLCEANRLAERIPRDESGRIDDGGFFSVAADTPDACRRLAAELPIFSAPFYARPKWVVGGRWMSMTGISGIFIPFTAEANVNPETPSSHLPFTMCHEAAHRMGAVREDEANFTAFLCCVWSANELYNYSGYLLGYIYAFNALYACDRQAAEEIRATQSERVAGDLRLYSAYISRYEGPVQTAGTAVNDLYLKSMGQSEGVHSYGRMVDLLCAWCMKEKGDG